MCEGLFYLPVRVCEVSGRCYESHGLDSGSPARSAELDSILVGLFQFETSYGLNSREYVVLLHATI